MKPAPEWKQQMDFPRLKSLAEFFGVPKPVIGMVHLWPLPGAPGYTGYGMQTIIDHALRDAEVLVQGGVDGLIVDRKSTRLNSSHRCISYAVFCLKKKTE